MKRAWFDKKELRDLDRKMTAGLGSHFVKALHRACRRRERTEAFVLETLCRLNPWLFADHSRSLDLFGAAVAVGDNPVSRDQLDWESAKVRNFDLVGEQEAAIAGSALFRNETRFHFDLNTLSDGSFGHRGIQIPDEGLKSRNNRQPEWCRVQLYRLETGLMDRVHSTDKSVMELVRFPLHSARLAMLVLVVVLAGCSENKRNPPDDGDGDYSKKSASCEAYMACTAERGAQVLSAWGVSVDLQAALLDSCADADVSALPENIQNAQAALLAECAQ